jgi:DNA-binding IscR family transcriptional regulator
LKEERVILATEDDPPTYVPARDIETIRLQEITAAARGQAAVRLSKVQALIDQINNAISESLKGQTLKDLVLADKESPKPMAPNPGGSS